MEDVIELHTHGGTVCARRVLQACIEVRRDGHRLQGGGGMEVQRRTAEALHCVEGNVFYARAGVSRLVPAGWECGCIGVTFIDNRSDP